MARDDKMKRILPIIVLAQFFGTSVWFAGNAVLTEWLTELNLPGTYLSHLTSAVQLGFVTGTFLFALLTISDRYSPSRVFAVCSLLASLSNLLMLVPGAEVATTLFSRFLTGFFLAGIYPVGMKIASDHYKEGLGRSLGFLLAALVLGTASPHLVRGLSFDLPWKFTLLTTSVLAVTGGALLLWGVPDGPFRKKGNRIDVYAFFQGFKKPEFRAAAFGYFGHMWELYTFWAFIPILLTRFNDHHPGSISAISLTSFSIIAIGAITCILAGLYSQKLGAKNIAGAALSLSFLCCLASPWIVQIDAPVLFVGFLLVWGASVIPDSPMFSTLIARYAPEESRGSALTFINSMGFLITIISLQFIGYIQNRVLTEYLFLFLAIGPAVGLVGLFSRKAKTRA